MATGMNLSPSGVGGMLTYAGETVTIASANTAVVVAGTTTPRGDAGGFTIGVTGIITATFPGTRLCRIRLSLIISPIATNVDNLVIQINVNDVSVFESANNDINDTTPEEFYAETYALISNGDTIKGYVENEDTTANIIVAAYTDNVNAAHQTGYLSVQGA